MSSFVVNLLHNYSYVTKCIKRGIHNEQKKAEVLKIKDFRLMGKKEEQRLGYGYDVTLRLTRVHWSFGESTVLMLLLNGKKVAVAAHRFDHLRKVRIRGHLGANAGYIHIDITVMPIVVDTQNRLVQLIPVQRCVGVFSQMPQQIKFSRGKRNFLSQIGGST